MSLPEPESATQHLPVRAPVPRWHTYALLHLIVALYSLGGICSKMAAGQDFLSFTFCAWYGGVLCILAVYAVVWQQVLKRLPLTTAFANKGATLAWGLLWGALIFDEQISLWMYVGVALVFAGILLVVSDDARQARAATRQPQTTHERSGAEQQQASGEGEQP